MRDKKIKKTHKWFWDYDYDKQEKFYTEMQAKGWALIKQEREGEVYEQRFEKCEPANVVYKIGYNAEKTGRGSYIQMFEDYGWEFVGETNDFYCFRKSADGVSPEELDIFSDDGSRLDMAKNAAMAWLPILLMCALLMLVPQTVDLLGNTGRGWLDWLPVVLLWAVYLWGSISVYLGWRRHKRQIEERQSSQR